MSYLKVTTVQSPEKKEGKIKLRKKSTAEQSDWSMNHKVGGLNSGSYWPRVQDTDTR